MVCPGTPEYDEAEQIVAQAQVPGGGIAPNAGAAPDAAASGLQIEPLDQAPWWVTLFTSMFMHGGFLHIAGNLLFLWVFGNNIEDSMGRVKFTAFYLAAGLVAVYSQAALDVDSTVPTIGASGAVAGVLGAYALLHPAARVLSLIIIIFFVTLVEVPALLLLGIWFVLQFVPALGQVATPEVGGGEGIAYFAHVGGFIFGLATIKLLARRRDPPDRRARRAQRARRLASGERGPGNPHSDPRRRRHLLRPVRGADDRRRGQRRRHRLRRRSAC